MSVIARVYGLDPRTRAGIGVLCVLATFALIWADTYWVIAVLPFLLGTSITNRLVPGGRRNLVPRTSPPGPARSRLPFSLAAGAVLVIGAAAAFVTDDMAYVAVASVGTIAITVAADALAPSRPAR
ncbi:hypothetical protein [Luteipulveratus flavus]|uniref:DUF4395 domain-containing protein n=1 Tax=Luteipulveratus flavus TaxID=3031728 RepID=A0ABT6C7I0_9MICO|nr:hypothetical protein [Luteipulveratus sp. YIM 133296]MDF8264666.1 hypothetical protein [Luteipulveratus sp. YIM 133296]